MRPAELVTKPQARGDDIRNTRSEQGTSQVNNHSASRGPASSDIQFHYKDKEPPAIEIEVTKKLKLPTAGEKGLWKGVEEDLLVIVDGVSAEDEGKRLDSAEKLIYSYLASRFSEDEKRPYISKGEKENKETKILRLAKRDARKKKKDAKRVNDQNCLDTAKSEYLKLVRLHNKSRRNEIRKRKKKEDKKEQEQFRRNPYQFGKKLLDGKKKNDPPTFSKEAADRFFKSEYCDKDRGALFARLSGLPDAPIPKNVFDMGKLSWEEFQEKLMSRRNRSSPGPNGVPYLVYKRCPKVAKLIFSLLDQLWQKKMVPLHWRIGESILIAKTEDTSDPSKFRNITKTNTSGKLQLGLLADKMLEYMVDNGYIDKSIQKGFLKKTPGCVEHTQTLMEELKDAKSARRQIYVVWVDLMNAYGRVPHNLILYALRHYKFPEWLIEYMFKYYDELIVRVVTKNWKTNWFFYMLGLFQGDPLSVVLFLIVFNLLLDLLKSQKELGYKPSFSSDSTSSRAFADDLTLISPRLEKMKKLVAEMERFLMWSRKMRAKPSKCISLGMKVIDGTYKSFDPEILVGGSQIQFIGDTPIKFLGHWIYVDLGLKDTKERIEDKLMALFQAVEQSGLNGVMKCWIYNNLLTSKLSWDLMIYNLPVSFVKDLEAICTRYLKKWLGLTKSITVSVLYRKKDYFGLNLKRLTDLYKLLQVTKGYTLKNSEDPKVREAYKSREEGHEGSSLTECKREGLVLQRAGWSHSEG
ncbi:hypothetical protein ACHWQZ_G005344 [Mnemiopsis leidyi]